MIAIELNGEARDVEPGQHVQGLIATLALSNQALAVAINREIVPRHLWDNGSCSRTIGSISCAPSAAAEFLEKR